LTADSNDNLVLVSSTVLHTSFENLKIVSDATLRNQIQNAITDDCIYKVPEVFCFLLDNPVSGNKIFHMMKLRK
jgi:hypothetical protein